MGLMGAVVSLDDVAKSLNGHRAIDGLTLEIPDGTLVGLPGRNGAGKTTTIRMIMDIIPPDSGGIRVFGTPMDEPIKDRTGYLPEERGLYPKMRVLDMLQFHETVKYLSPSQAGAAASRRLDRLELGDRKSKQVEELSRGMQQKVQFIFASG